MLSHAVSSKKSAEEKLAEQLNRTAAEADAAVQAVRHCEVEYASACANVTGLQTALADMEKVFGSKQTELTAQTAALEKQSEVLAAAEDDRARRTTDLEALTKQRELCDSELKHAVLTATNASNAVLVATHAVADSTAEHARLVRSSHQLTRPTNSHPLFEY